MIADQSPCEYIGSLDDAGRKLIQIDTETTNSILLLLGAGTVDELRNRF